MIDHDPITPETEDILKAAHNSLAVRWGTSAPYAITHRPRPVTKGFGGGVASITVEFVCPADAGAIIPIARQCVYSYLAEHGYGPDDVHFRPMVTHGGMTWYYGGRTTVMFENENECATDAKGKPVPVGKRKRGDRWGVSFELVDRRIAKFGGGSLGEMVPRA